jgi:hypothetical protein
MQTVSNVMQRVLFLVQTRRTLMQNQDEEADDSEGVTDELGSNVLFSVVGAHIGASRVE